MNEHQMMVINQLAVEEKSDIKTYLDGLTNLMYSLNMIEVFGWVSILTQTKSQNIQFDNISDLPLLEFLIGLGIKIDNSSLEKPTLSNIFSIIEGGKKYFNEFILSEKNISFSGEDPAKQILSLSIFHSLIYQRNTGRYPFQTEEYLKSFKPSVNLYFLEKYGFSIRDAYKFAQDILYSLNEKIVRRFDIAHKKGRKYGFTNEIYLSKLFENPHKLMEIRKDQFPYDEDTKKMFTSFLDTLSCKFGEGFKDYSTPLNYNIIFDKPIIFFNGRYYCFIPNIFFQKLPSIIESLLDTEKKSESKIWTRFVQNKSDYTEDKTIQILSKLFSPNKIFSNLFYYSKNNERFEIDLLIKEDYALFFFEIKSGGFKTYSKFKGIKGINTDVKKLVEDAFKQSNQLVEHLKINGIVKLENEKKQPILELNFDSEKKPFFQISITLEPLFSYAINLSLFTPQGLFINGEYPWTINIYEFEVIIELIRNPTIFVHYLICRNKYLNENRVLSFDELSFFLYYLTDPSLSIMKDKSEIPFIQLHPAFLDCLDHYYLTNENPPELNIPKVIMHILDQIDKEKPYNYYLISQSILNLNSKIKIELNERIVDGLDRVRNTKKGCPFSFLDKNSNVGFTIALITKNDELNISLHELCVNRKNEYSANNWIGITMIVKYNDYSYSEIVFVN